MHDVNVISSSIVRRSQSKVFLYRPSAACLLPVAPIGVRVSLRAITGSLARGIKIQSVPQLANRNLAVFREQAFVPELPALLRTDGLSDQLPAMRSWFHPMIAEDRSYKILKHEYLSQFGDSMVNLEVTHHDLNNRQTTFEQLNAPFSFFLNWTEAQCKTMPIATSSDHSSASRQQQQQQQKENRSIYLAQHQLSSLPQALQSDLPTPDLVLHAGKGDIYDSNIWIGTAPTYTPLHRDPNPNYFLQLSGTKIVRLFPPRIGNEIFHGVQCEIGATDSAIFRGHEMMQGKERRVLEEVVWGPPRQYRKVHDKEQQAPAPPGLDQCWQAIVEQGTALFIPRGWWHSIRGIGRGVIASVNWWFR